MGVETSRGSREVNAQGDLGREKQAIPSLEFDPDVALRGFWHVPKVYKDVPPWH